MSSKIPLVFAFSNRGNIPAFDVRFLATKLIILFVSLQNTKKQEQSLPLEMNFFLLKLSRGLKVLFIF